MQTGDIGGNIQSTNGEGAIQRRSRQDLGRWGRDTTEHVTGLLREISHLIAEEGRLARTEASEKLSEIKRGIGTSAAGGGILFAGFLLILGGIVTAMALVMPTWLAALIVGTTLLVVGGGLLYAGRMRISGENLKLERIARSTRHFGEAMKMEARR